MTLLKAASHHIPTGRRKLYTQQVPAEILAMMEERDDLRKQDPASPRLSIMNDEITKATSDHKRRQWREFVESIDHRTDSTKLWRTIKGIEGKSRQTSDNEGIIFTGTPHPSGFPTVSTVSSPLLSWANTLHRGGLVTCRRM